MQQDSFFSDVTTIPRLITSALKGGSGKTIISIGIIAAWKRSGKLITPFKKGPDYIDAGWLAMAAGQSCYNLDTFLIKKQTVKTSFVQHSINSDISVIEGNRGLYDGIDVEDSTSTAEISKLLKSPVILCLDCTKTTRTMAAIVLGCIQFDPEVNIQGVVLNRVARKRHENILTRTIEYHCGIPVVGSVPKLSSQDFPERHMGLVPTFEHEWAIKSVKAAGDMAQKYINLDTLSDIALSGVSQKRVVDQNRVSYNVRKDDFCKNLPVIGVLKDSAFQFYYPDNIEALEQAGAKIVYVSPLKDKELPDVDGLYIGGGFPETHAKELTGNYNIRNQLKALADKGLPIYAECGGLMYLGEKLVINHKSYPMTGILPISFGIAKKPQGHGYTVIKIEKANPYFDVGIEIKGHEFRYSKVIEWNGNDSDMVFNMQRGTGIINNKDGICYKNTLATYTHIHALGTPSWAYSLVKNALNYKNNKKK